MRPTKLATKLATKGSIYPLATGDREAVAEAGDHTQRTQILRKIRCASPLFQAQPEIADGTTNFPQGFREGRWDTIRFNGKHMAVGRVSPKPPRLGAVMPHCNKV